MGMPGVRSHFGGVALPDRFACAAGLDQFSDGRLAENLLNAHKVGTAHHHANGNSIASGPPEALLDLLASPDS
jgi:hypothetical protein